MSKVKSSNVASADVDSIVDSLVNISLSKIVQANEDSEQLTIAIAEAGTVEQRLCDPNALTTTASAPELQYRSMPLYQFYHIPPQTSSPSGFVPPMSECDLIAAAIAKFKNSIK
ncbi:hypothetical protein F5878DRAFT_666792 [Lentinula raphanica]|uniref:Uncharacterized protein n=1 Tax=Lentinula raphanica TaxID=153919 RepID=A0AA38U4R6_9AGAR|nr:hypothetical protein F5878DRAFT_666792 [Lentinula raphanica]